MDKKDYKLNDYNFGRHISIKPYVEYMNEDTDDGHLLSMAQHIYIAAMDNIENVIVNDIIRVAQDSCVTDVILLDKPKIVDALKKATPMKCTEEACPSCIRGVKSFSADYCPHCGQKLVWWGDSND